MSGGGNVVCTYNLLSIDFGFSTLFGAPENAKGNKTDENTGLNFGKNCVTGSYNILHVTPRLAHIYTYTCETSSEIRL